MGVHKASSNKAPKKSSKLDSLKNLVFGSANSTAKKQASSTKSSVSQKKVSSSANKTQSGKTNSVHSKSGGKVKVSSSAVQAGLKSAVSQESKTAALKSSGITSKKGAVAGGRLDVLGETVCREVACEGLATSAGYCRMHYIKNWKKIKRKELILREKKLNQYIEELVAKYPDKYIEAIRQDLASDKDFAKVIYDLDLDEGVDDFDIEGSEAVDSLIDTIKRDFDDDGEGY